MPSSVCPFSSSPSLSRSTSLSLAHTHTYTCAISHARSLPWHKSQSLARIHVHNDEARAVRCHWPLTTSCRTPTVRCPRSKDVIRFDTEARWARSSQFCVFEGTRLQDPWDLTNLARQKQKLARCEDYSATLPNRFLDTFPSNRDSLASSFRLLAFFYPPGIRNPKRRSPIAPLSSPLCISSPGPLLAFCSSEPSHHSHNPVSAPLSLPGSHAS